MVLKDMLPFQSEHKLHMPGLAWMGGCFPGVRVEPGPEPLWNVAEQHLETDGGRYTGYFTLAC